MLWLIDLYSFLINKSIWGHKVSMALDHSWDLTKNPLLISLVIIFLFSEKIEREKREKEIRRALTHRGLFFQFSVQENGFPLEGLLPALLFGFVLGPPSAESWMIKEKQNPENLPHKSLQVLALLAIHVLFSVRRQLPFVFCCNQRGMGCRDQHQSPA